MSDAIRSELPHTVVGPPPEYYPLKCSTSSEILTPLLWKSLRDVLPKRILTYCVKRLYASYEDGYGLIPLLRSILVFSLTHRNAGTEAPTLLLFQMEANRDILIVYRDDCWQNRMKGRDRRTRCSCDFPTTTCVFGGLTARVLANRGCTSVPRTTALWLAREARRA